MRMEKRLKTVRSAEPAKTMADYAMSFDRLGLWIGERAKSATLRHPQATSLSMLDGAVAAVVAGPVSMMPEEWICPLLGVDPDDFNHDTETFSAIAATLTRHNAIVNALSTKPESFEPLFMRTPRDEVDPRAWCMGFYAVIKLRLLAWYRLMSPNATEPGLLLPILFHCVDASGRPVLDDHRRRLAARSFAREAGRDIPTVVEAMRQFWMPSRFARIHSRRSKPGRHVYPRTAYVRFGMEVVAGDAQRLRARIAGTNAPSESLRVCSGYWPKRRETFRGLRRIVTATTMSTVPG